MNSIYIAYFKTVENSNKLNDYENQIDLLNSLIKKMENDNEESEKKYENKISDLNNIIKELSDSNESLQLKIKELSNKWT